MIDDKTTQLEQELAALVGRNAEWLSGRQLLEIAERLAHGLFDDAAELQVVDCGELLVALDAAFRNDPTLGDIEQRCAAVDARLAALAAKDAPPAG